MKKKKDKEDDLTQKQKVEIMRDTLDRLSEICVRMVVRNAPFNPHQMILMATAQMIEEFAVYCVKKEMEEKK